LRYYVVGYKSKDIFKVPVRFRSLQELTSFFREHEKNEKLLALELALEAHLPRLVWWTAHTERIHWERRARRWGERELFSLSLGLHLARSERGAFCI
jgi:hypothetical protein